MYSRRFLDLQENLDLQASGHLDEKVPDEVKQFLVHHSQITNNGIFQLHQELTDGELALFYASNHINTICKRGESLYLLITAGDMPPEVMWETLENRQRREIEYVFSPPPSLPSTRTSPSNTPPLTAGT